MRSITLSIVVPTKNRYEYLFSFIEVCNGFHSDDFELVIQDNSDDNSEIVNYLSSGEYTFVSYFYDASKLSMSQNSSLGIKNSRGKYICFMGDDDCVSYKLIEFARFLDSQDINDAIFKKVSYYWPGVVHKAHRFPNLFIREYSGTITEIDSKKAFSAMLNVGATTLYGMPQLYHSIVKREVLEKIYKRVGTYFPGPSPDMAIAVALAQTIDSHLFVDAPLVTSGSSPKSSAGLGASHNHRGRLKDVPFLPRNIEEIWDKRIPMIWTGPTIYAETAIESMRSTGGESNLSRFNFAYFYAYFDVFHREYKHLSKEAKSTVKYSRILYCLYYIRIILLRVRIYIKNVFLTKFHVGAKIYDGVENVVKAQRIIDELLNMKGVNYSIRRKM